MCPGSRLLLSAAHRAVRPLNRPFKMSLHCLLPLLVTAVVLSQLMLTSATDPAEVEVTGSLVAKRAEHLCGGDLINAIVSVCYQRRRRSEYDGLSAARSWLELSPNDVISPVEMTSLRRRVLQSLFSPHSQERRLLSSGLRYKRGDSIVERCCYEGNCDVSTLRMYC